MKPSSWQAGTLPKNTIKFSKSQKITIAYSVTISLGIPYNNLTDTTSLWRKRLRNKMVNIIMSLHVCL